MLRTRGCLVVFTTFYDVEPSYKRFLTGGGLILGVVLFPSKEALEKAAARRRAREEARGGEAKAKAKAKAAGYPAS